MLWTLRQIFLFCASRPFALVGRELLLWPAGIWPWQPRPAVTAVPGRGCGKELLAVPFCGLAAHGGHAAPRPHRARPSVRRT